MLKKTLPLLLTISLAVSSLGGLLYQLTTASAYIATSPTAVDTPLHTLTELFPSQVYTTWFQSHTGYAPDPNYFGAYKFEPIGDQLYLGFGTARPGERNGSLLAVTKGTILTAVSPLDEQGFIDMQAASDGFLYIPGPDPVESPTPPAHEWDWGNFYVKAPHQPITKYRNLPNVIHSWGLWLDEENEVLYTAVSSHFGDRTISTGEVFSSTDRAASWHHVAHKDEGVGDYRTYDIIGFNDNLYTIASDIRDITPEEPHSCELVVSTDAGQTWTRRTSRDAQPLTCRSRLHVWNDHLLLLAHDRQSLWSINKADTLTNHPLTDDRFTAWAYNYLTHTPDGYLYSIAEQGQVMRTNDLENWETIAHSDLDLMTIGYWPEHDWLLLGERGHGRVWQLDLAQIRPLPYSNFQIFIPIIAN